MSKTPDGDTPDFLRPLSRRYTRTPLVSAELEGLSRLPRRHVLTRAAEPRQDRWLCRETLTALVRGFLRAGDRDAADAVLDTLVRRQRPALDARARAWRTLSPVDFEDAAAEAVSRLMAYVRSLDGKDEFWECNFGGCFHLRMDSVFKSVAGRRGDAPPLTTEGADGGGRDRLAETPDPRGEVPFADVEAQDVRRALCHAVPHIGEYLYLSGQGYSDTEIAERLSVTDRTLRNWKAKAREFLTEHARE